jgi:hypothetical protein
MGEKLSRNFLEEKGLSKPASLEREGRPKGNPGWINLPGFWKRDPSATGKALPAFPRWEG